MTSTIAHSLTVFCLMPICAVTAAQVNVTYTFADKHVETRTYPLVQAGAATYTGLFGEAARIDKWTFSTNGVAICGKHGIPTIGFGPGNEIYAHAPNERTPIDHLEKASAFYALLPYVLEEHT